MAKLCASQPCSAGAGGSRRRLHLTPGAASGWENLAGLGASPGLGFWMPRAACMHAAAWYLSRPRIQGGCKTGFYKDCRFTFIIFMFICDFLEHWTPIFECLNFFFFQMSGISLGLFKTCVECRMRITVIYLMCLSKWKFCRKEKRGEIRISPWKGIFKPLSLKVSEKHSKFFFEFYSSRLFS